jgi:hypothetical protein
MKSKWPLFTGIFLLVTGILFRIFTNTGFTGIAFILTGVAFKVYYVIIKIRQGIYKPGKELIVLYTGVGLFMIGLYMRSANSALPYVFLMASGIFLKVTFIFLFIKKTHKAGKIIQETSPDSIKA